ncbi:hypothetical protein JX265_009824 [Neoarthrinium moseri]|uniref:Epoxide hydrolase N-terminal domain-containing protein n=1 Tax=Neoarthrinium moseri TaxID=1658444 RepID=A0A9P9WF25_9PEZI|nr:uncharacterized protein JN550_005423 [Neoarthrinium moseri]KAI1860425.1 hypothetical protein JX265_009824 [Neoarthrinium moseri]KAI1869833.1 hypothetical protein JN550_005423 [Neoarthrinium moseri]
MADFAQLPPGLIPDVKPFQICVDEAKLQHFRTLLELSPIGPTTFENTHAGRRYGVTREWLATAKQAWLHDFDWRRSEARLNSFPSFRAPVRDDETGYTTEVHFLGLFSARADAVPIVFLHGWPGSICEFLDIMDLLRAKYTPQTLPYHVVVPSLPGYGFSSGPPVDADYGVMQAAKAIHGLMLGLGFGKSGYLVQGGDLGSFVARAMALIYPECRGMHVNQMGFPPPGVDIGTRDAAEERAFQRATEAIDTGLAFAMQQGTRAATMGLALSASPLALLAWIGEKFLEFSDQDPPLDKILEGVMLYWLTDTYPRCLYHNREMGDPKEEPKIARYSVLAGKASLHLPYVAKPCGFSHFPHEVVPVPRSWAEKSVNLVTFSEHQLGGHFAALERPNELLADVEEYVEKVWKP